MEAFIHGIEYLQEYLDLEKSLFWGIRADHIAHLALPFLLQLFFVGWRRAKTGLVLLFILIAAKEIADLGVIYYYEPIRLKQWLDSSIDFHLGLLGLAVAQKYGAECLSRGAKIGRRCLFR